MALKFTDSFVRNCYEFMLQGNTLKATGDRFSCNPDNLSKAVRALNLPIPEPKRVPKNKKDLPLEKLNSMLQSGMSVKAIAEELDVSRTLVTRIFKEGGVQLRNRSEAMYLRMSKTSRAERKQLTKSAHDATRGKSKSADHRNKIAVARNAIKYDHLIGGGEKHLRGLLDARGIKAIWQAPIDSYNIDLLTSNNVAVELTTEGGDRFWSKPEQEKRIKHLAERNIRTLCISFTCDDALSGHLDYIISNIDFMGSLEAPIRQYRVIRCGLTDRTVYRNEFGQFASKLTPNKLYGSCKDVGF